MKVPAALVVGKGLMLRVATMVLKFLLGLGSNHGRGPSLPEVECSRSVLTARLDAGDAPRRRRELRHPRPRLTGPHDVGATSLISLADHPQVALGNIGRIHRAG